MFSVLHPSAYQMISGLLQALYPLWASLWFLVAFHYGRAAYASWLSAGRGWKYAFQDFISPVTWAITDMFCAFRIGSWQPFGRWAVCNATIPTPYESGHLLRFSIFLGSISPIIFGFVYLGLDRSEWLFSRLIVNFVTVLISIVAAGGHLFLAYMHEPRAWRRLVILSILWLAMAIPVISAWHLYE